MIEVAVRAFNEFHEKKLWFRKFFFFCDFTAIATSLFICMLSSTQRIRSHECVLLAFGEHLCLQHTKVETQKITYTMTSVKPAEAGGEYCGTKRRKLNIINITETTFSIGCQSRWLGSTCRSFAKENRPSHPGVCRSSPGMHMIELCIQ